MLKIRSVDSDYGQIGFGISAGDCGGIGASVVECHFQIARTRDNMAVGENESVPGDEESRSAARAAFTGLNPNIHDAGSHPVNYRRNDLGVGIKQLIVVSLIGLFERTGKGSAQLRVLAVCLTEEIRRHNVTIMITFNPRRSNTIRCGQAKLSKRG